MKICIFLTLWCRACLWRTMSESVWVKKYSEMVNNAQIRKKKIKARSFSKHCRNSIWVWLSLYHVWRCGKSPILSLVELIWAIFCSEIFKATAPVSITRLSYRHIGHDISCNLVCEYCYGNGFTNFAHTVSMAIRALSNVSEMTKIESVLLLKR